MRYVAIGVLVLAVCSAALSQESVSSTQPVSATVVDRPASAGAAKQQSSSFERFATKIKFFPDVSENKEPLSVGGKFKLFAVQSVSPANITGAAAGAGLGQARDWPEGYGQGWDGYGKRFGANLATGASKSFFGNFLIPAVLHQDPRFFPRGNSSFRQSLKYGLRRAVITRTDSGDDAFNWSGILAPIAAQSIANSYLPERERTVGKTFIRSGRMIGMSVGVNVLKEFWPAISRRLGHKQQ